MDEDNKQLDPLTNPYLHIYTPIKFRLTQIMSTISTQQVEFEDGTLNEKN